MGLEAIGAPSSRSYLLDNNVISYFFNAERKDALARIARMLPLVVVGEVHEEALRYRSKGDEYCKWQAANDLTVTRIPVGSPASQRLAMLRRGSGGLKDLGELASIALASEDPSLLLVMNDKNGIWIALRELLTPTENVIRWSTFLRRAQETVQLSQKTVLALAEVSQLNHAPPTWWSEWMSNLDDSGVK